MTNTSDPHHDDAEIHLSADEAIVLFELLSRWCGSKAIHTPTPDSKCFESTAECAVLHGVLASLEKQLVAPFKEDYHQIVKEARRRLVDLWDYPTLKG
ncbi:hypothetical protein G6K93_23630 [Agrobacterium rhizogenes]|uniref:hypothetical protein n=1 Tax=Rhizobium rhizogenes TaxID=359 RepID=UPI001238473D|nr:hypothetical protein [Rhizobium rhizogenes]KAA6487780.1 hypothetical protein DXT98_12465 [Agrobacterium sp. ICMP 7243]NTG03322.1 hypothetical protein [Rhizobium rhizogenes]NTG16803.1 hypothetical protein [Rhizobium rhizogenes]NTG23506.1 hypothetical protein [Rhizobium rhizogenes]NTG30415.1 hypothetical protein [Rhizobium rhizogenes]